MKDHVHIGDGALHLVEVAHVALHPLDILSQVIRPSVGVNLRSEIVEDSHFVTLPEQRVGYVRSDKAGAAGDQDSFRHLSRSH